MEDYKRLTQREEEPHLGKWLVENLAGLGKSSCPRAVTIGLFRLRTGPMRTPSEPSRPSLDPNVLSELLRPAADPRVIAFVEEKEDPIVCAAAFHELTYGVEMLLAGTKKARLSAGIETFRRRFGERTIAIDAEIADISGRLRAGETRDPGSRCNRSTL